MKKSNDLDEANFRQLKLTAVSTEDYVTAKSRRNIKAQLDVHCRQTNKEESEGSSTLDHVMPKEKVAERQMMSPT